MHSGINRPKRIQDLAMLTFLDKFSRDLLIPKLDRSSQLNKSDTYWTALLIISNPSVERISPRKLAVLDASLDRYGRAGFIYKLESDHRKKEVRKHTKEQELRGELGSTRFFIESCGEVIRKRAKAYKIGLQGIKPQGERQEKSAPVEPSETSFYCGELQIISNNRHVGVILRRLFLIADSPASPAANRIPCAWNILLQTIHYTSATHRPN